LNASPKVSIGLFIFYVLQFQNITTFEAVLIK